MYKKVKYNFNEKTFLYSFIFFIVFNVLYYNIVWIYTKRKIIKK